MSQRVGIVGLGLMGTAFTKNLIEAGFEVQGYDIEPKRMGEFKTRGGEPVDSPAAAANGVNHVITSLPTSEIVRQAVLGPKGIAEGAKPGFYLTDTTTSRPEDSMRLAEELSQQGIRFLDAAVSGTSTMAMEKDLVIIAGGEQEDFDTCRPVFAGFSRQAYHMGPVGSGARTKLVINLILAGNRLALAEGLLLGEKVGLELWQMRRQWAKNFIESPVINPIWHAELEQHIFSERFAEDIQAAERHGELSLSPSRD